MNKTRSAVRDFFTLWVVLFMTFLLVRMILTLFFYGWIDLRRIPLLELLLVPVGQTLALWIIVRKKPTVARKLNGKEEAPTDVR